VVGTVRSRLGSRRAVSTGIRMPSPSVSFGDIAASPTPSGVAVGLRNVRDQIAVVRDRPRCRRIVVVDRKDYRSRRRPYRSGSSSGTVSQLSA
jgi:hypothetical protein